MSRILVPTNNAEAIHMDNMVNAIIQADDTPSRHPCKIRTKPKTATSGGSYRMDPYRAQVLELTSSDDEDDAAYEVAALEAIAAAENSAYVSSSSVSSGSNTPMQTSLNGYTPSVGLSPATVSPMGTPYQHQQHEPVHFQVSPPPPQPHYSPAPHQAQQPQQPSQPLQPPQQVGSAKKWHVTKTTTAPSSSKKAHSQPHQPTVAQPSARATPLPSHGIKYATVCFKHLKDCFFIPTSARADLLVGDFVVVEGDRGENVGQVVEDVTPTHERNDPIGGRVIRKATLADRRLWESARRRETEASAMCQAFAEDFNVRMHVEDTEFQTDMNKLTIYYRTLCGGPVDFRQMQRALFKHYRCRIWLVDVATTPM